MTLADIISLISFLVLLYFAYGTWRIDQKLGKVEQHLENIGSIMQAWSDDRDTE